MGDLRPFMLSALNSILSYRLDLLLLTLLVLTGAGLAHRHLRQRTGRGLSRRSWWLCVGLLLAGSLSAEWAVKLRSEQLERSLGAMGPTYAVELASLGHADIGPETGPYDPIYLQIIEAQKLWLRANPLIADLYTFRRDADGNIRLIADSETDYDHNSRFEGTREQRTALGEIYAEATPKFHAALDGKPQFESAIIPDRWGFWVSSFTPIYDRNGRVEAAVGIDFPAEGWLWALVGVRAAVLAVTLVVAIILLVSATFIARLSAEIVRREAIQARLEQASESAFAASAAKSEFLALMSHEVRTPLSAILGFANILSDTALAPAQRRYVDTINRAGANLLDLLNHILDYTKAESGKMTLEHIAWAPALTIHEVMELMTARAAEKNLPLNFDNQLPGNLTLLGDPVRIRQVVLNLVNNAVKFTESGSVGVRAGWQGAGPRGRLLIEVADTGPGIPADRLPLLFQAFSQADASTTRRHGGTGLGLAICRRLVDMMNGRLDVQSEIGRGSVFTFTLECATAEAAGAALFHADGETPPPLPLWNRALVVDDTKLNRELLKVMLRRLGLDADVAASGPEAVQLAGLNRYAIVFMDLEMPDMDGFATANRIRAQETPDHRVPIVAVSALTASGTREKCLAAGMDDYLVKPVYLPALRSTIEATLPGVLPRTDGSPVLFTAA